MNTIDPNMVSAMMIDGAEDLYAILEPILLIVLAMPRVVAATILIPFLSKNSLSAELIRYGMCLSFVIILLPWLQDTVTSPTDLSVFQIGGYLLKEGLIGAAVGLILAIPFWAVEGIGFFVDNQRGSTLASALNPMTGSQTSTLGIMMGQVAIVGFISYGGLLIYIDFFYTTFKIWPIDQFFPSFQLDNSVYFIEQMDRLMMLVVVLASPAIIAMFLSEFCFALVNRSAQQLNVFVLSMPVKSAVGFFILLVYMDRMFVYLLRQDSTPALMLKYLDTLLQ